MAKIIARRIAYAARVFLKTSANNWDPISMNPIGDDSYEAKALIHNGDQYGFLIIFNGGMQKWVRDFSNPNFVPSGVGNGYNSIF
ncbi:hypothetical protein HYS03_01365 [Candidatus Woesebacteria bacterium]|nr:hypothetical protein [Candidatus Woesebacteria bacterium]QQG47308.1 MAG: hypothetical protein HY044_04245 [Candidatus Woesebacteria bacterium]